MAAAKDPFEKLLDACIKAFSIAYNDTTALDATGVLGKDRVLVVENPRYKRETRKLRAQRTLDELNEVAGMMSDMNSAEAETEAPEEESVTPDDEYDIRGSKGKKKKQKVEAPPRVPKFDKGKLEMRLKLLQQRREILTASKGTEEKETDALNIFFIPVTKEEFEAMSVNEVFEEAQSVGDPFSEGTLTEVKAAVGSEILKGMKKGKKESTSFHYEGDGDDKVMVED